MSATPIPPEADLAKAEAEYEAFVWANLRRNYTANYVHGMLGMTGFRLVNAPTFLPAYLRMLSGSDAIVGLGLALQQLGGVVSPVIGANMVEHKPKVLPTAVVFGTLMRVPILLMALSGWFLSGLPLLASLLVLLFLLGLFSGPQRVVFQLLMAKVIPISRRGRLQAWRNMTGGLIAAGLAYLAGRYLIQNNVLGNGYATTFMIAFVLTSLGLTVLRLLVREPAPPTLRPQMKLRDRIREFPQIIASDRDFRNFLITQLLAMGARLAAPFYILDAGRSVTLDGAAIGLFSVAFLGADTLSNLLWGYVGDRTGFRVGYLVSLALWIAATALLMVSHTTGVFVLAFIGLGAAQSGYAMSSQTMVLEFGLREDMAIRLAISSMVEGVMAAIGPLAGGLLASRFGYNPVFGLSIGFLAAALVLLWTGVREPRLAKA